MSGFYVYNSVSVELNSLGVIVSPYTLCLVTPTITPSPTPTPEILIDAILVSPDEYLSVGDNEYLQY